MSRFYVPKGSIEGDRITIGGKEAHHILDVMRLNVSDKVTVFDGTGTEYAGVVTEAGRKTLSLKIVSRRTANTAGKNPITLIQAIPKKDKMDHIVEKATELGVAGIMPVVTLRTVPDWTAQKKISAVERWKKIALEAAKQCGRADIPQISAVSDIRDALSGMDGYAVKLIAALAEGSVRLKEALKEKPAGKVAIAIGPEGDFTPDEVSAAADKGFKVVGLGRRVLKSDTAALAALAIIDHEYQD